ncbi:DNA-binding winged helix-turn-helix (wHTH) domain-containing protein [Candidatus Pantoea floridensis]|uniref:DNA-binding winged helix-turn-helix (WHTH) domain-containing protein n=2 Tax=Candidatus Pantoea floridensis TaxID=1938870 RepID=A0A286BWB5_9GAMM|nr:DNA-binding winged helix-turn-helix (wHTH) protein [Enterobacteriaceae bacterium JKS000233]SOD38429.1 DNA-binding winged helix-turn-helix (wHTH) domain-containing protein [Pantoea floridensis]
MMRYTLNACLIFDAVDGTLTPCDSATSESHLSVTASTLLLFFLQNTGVVNRDEVLKRVWDDNGHTSSNSNLNQYLSMLRKTFRLYGVDNVIVSISRGNLQLNPAISVEVMTSSANLLPDIVINTPDTFSTADNFSLSTTFWYLASAILLSLAFLLMIFTFYDGLAASAITLTHLHQEQCELSVEEEMLATFNQTAYVKNFNTVRKNLNVECLPGRKFIFFYGDKLQKQGLGRVFLAHCAKQRGNDFSYCDSYFYYSWNPT